MLAEQYMWKEFLIKFWPKGGVDDESRDADGVAEVQSGHPNWANHAGADADADVNPNADSHLQILILVLMLSPILLTNKMHIHILMQLVVVDANTGANVGMLNQMHIYRCNFRLARL